MRILCVCLGNICRSPTAEAVLRAMGPEINVDSAGTSDWHIGAPPYGPAIEAGARRGYDLAPLRAPQIRSGDLARRDGAGPIALDEDVRAARQVSAVGSNSRRYSSVA